MNRSLPLAAALAAICAPVTAQTYQPRGFLRTGYSDRQVAPDRWEVAASSHDEGGSVPAALYHAAEIAGAAGIAELRVVRQKVTTQRMIRRSSGTTIALTEKTQLTVRAIRGDADRAACEMPEARRCLTLPVAGLLAAYGPGLRMPAALPGQAVATPVLLTTRSTEWPFAGQLSAGADGGPMVRLLRDLAGQHALAVPPPPVMAKPDIPKARLATSAGPSIPRPVTTATRIAATAVPSVVPAFRRPAKPSYEDRLRAAQPVDHDARLGWTASD